MRQLGPSCAICCEVLGKYGGPSTLPCGHNGCLQCLAHVQQNKPECPLCRAPFDGSRQLVVNHELRDLVVLAGALDTRDEDGWQTVTATKAGMQGVLDAGTACGVTLVPSAPPLRVCLEEVLAGNADLLSLEPPAWLPDSAGAACMACAQPFTFLRRTRHHCRLCGGLFCAPCTSRRALLPPKFQEKVPQRVCSACSELLQPLQPLLAGTIARAVQSPVHDVTDCSALRSWWNNPLSTSLDADIYKATNIVRQFASLGALRPEQRIPSAVLAGAAGFAVLTVARLGCGWSASAGTGLVVARTDDGNWSAPSALTLLRLGWGLQVGGEMTDLLVVLRTREALRAFTATCHLGVGGNVGLAVGPLGRSADATQHVGTTGRALCYSYSYSRGAFLGVSIEGSVLVARDAVNLDFYGRHHSPAALLRGDVAPPAAAAALYDGLDAMMTKVGEPAALPPGSLSAYLEEEDRNQLQPVTLPPPLDVLAQHAEHRTTERNCSATMRCEPLPVAARVNLPSSRLHGAAPAAAAAAPLLAQPLEGALGGALPLGAGTAGGHRLYPQLHGEEEPAAWMSDLFD